MAKSITEQAREASKRLDDLKGTLATKNASAAAAQAEIARIDKELVEHGFDPAKAARQVEKLRVSINDDLDTLEGLVG